MIEVKKDGVKHMIDPSQIDELDEISGDEQLSLTWWEWHWLERNV